MKDQLHRICKKPIIIAVVVLVAMVLIVYSTPYGVGLGFDSVAYISAAQNLRDGIGLGRITCIGFKPMVLWPPFYPMILALLSILGPNPIQAAHIISVLGYVAAVSVAVWMIGRVSRNILFPVLFAIFIFSSSPILYTFSWAMSEALFIPLSLVSLLLLYEYTESHKQGYLLGSAAAIGMAMVTRYVGIALLPVFLAVVLIDNQISIGQKIKNSVVGMVIAVLPLLAWFLRNDTVSQSGMGRRSGFTSLPIIEFDYFIRQVISWITPMEFDRFRYRLLFIGLFLAITVVMIFLFFFAQRTKKIAPQKGVMIFILYSLSYSLMILETILFSVPSISMVDERILVPLLMNLLILLVLIGASIWESKKWLPKVIFIIACIYLLSFYLPRQIKMLNLLHSNGQGYASREWQTSPSINYLKNIQSVVYTNDFQAIYFLAGKNACVLPMKDSDLSPMRENLARTQGYVVFFGSHMPEFHPVEEITQGMTLVGEYPNIFIYQQRTP